jgi:Skp family chaperone for outer membrane proteins
MPAMQRSLIVLGVPLAALVAVLSYQAGAVRPSLAIRPTSVGVVDLGQVLEKVNERAQWDANVRSMEERLKTEAQDRDARIRSSQERLRDMTEGEERTLLREQVAREFLEADAWFKFKRGELDREKALMWADLYRRIREEAESLAVAEGVELVLVNDSVAEIRTAADGNTSSEVLVLQQVTARRVLYAAREIDLTDRLVTRMNNAALTRPGGASK